MSAVQEPDAVGRVLADRYRIKRLLGRGGMGSVWEAEHIKLGTPLAIKLIRPGLADGERARARFLREARSAASLRGPHVVQVFDYGVDDGSPYIAMELLEGESLAQRLRRVGRLSSQDALIVITHVCGALAKAHGAGIVHRDLKPDNVFIVGDEDGERCKVVDFGIAKGIPSDTMEANTQSGAMLGTPYYMSPEQATSASTVDARSDLWSIGVIAYECIVGERPFQSDSLPAVAVKILVDPIPVPSEHGAVPPAFDAWFAKATQREPTARFQSARELANALATALGLEAPRVSWVASAPPNRGGTGKWVLAGAAALAIIAAGWWVATRPSEAPTTKPPVPQNPAVPTPAEAPEIKTPLVETTPPSPAATEAPANQTSEKPRRKPRPPAEQPDVKKANVDDLEF